MKKKIGRICALVVVGMFVIMTSVSTSANDPNDWSFGGNAFDGGGTETLGTTTNDNLAFITNNMQRMVVTSGGNVGIGTANPQYALDVDGIIHASGPLKIGNSIVIDGVNDRITATGGTIDFDNENLVTLGNVGIGTADPMEALEVNGDIRVNNIRLSSSEISDEDSIRMMIDSDGNAEDQTFVVSHDGDPDAELFRVQENGNVGIGVAWAINRLDVAGNMAVGQGFAGNVFPAPPNGMIIEGWVGIGTMFPDSNLHVSAGIEGDAELILESDTDNNNPDDNPCITFRQDGNDVNAFIALVGDFNARVQGALPDALVIGSEDPDVPAVQFATNDEVRMTIWANGMVGIGTIWPDATLDVDPRITSIDDHVGIRSDILFDPPGQGNIMANWYGMYVASPAVGDGDAITNRYAFVTEADAGNVGIGILNPEFTLDVDGDIHATGDLIIGNSIRIHPDETITADGGTIGFDDENLVTTGNVGIGLFPGMPPMNSLDVTDNVAVGEAYAGALPAPLNGMIIEGWVGIGTANPEFELQVEGTIQADALRIGNSITINGTDDKITATSGTINFDDENLVTTGNVGIGILPVSIPMNDLDVAGNVAVGEGFAGMFHAPPNGMIVKGDVGIGTPTPKYKLDVEGYVQAYGYYTGDIIFQKDGQKHWRMFEDVDGLYLENLETGKVYEFVLHEKKK